MYAIFETGGKQYKAKCGDVLDVEKLDAEPGETVTFDYVLTIADGDKIQVGTPSVDGAAVTAELESHYRDKKVVAYKLKRRKGYRRTKGHRQSLSRIRVLEIQGSGKATPAKADAAKKKTKRRLKGDIQATRPPVASREYKRPRRFYGARQLGTRASF